MDTIEITMFDFGIKAAGVYSPMLAAILAALLMLLVFRRRT